MFVQSLRKAAHTRRFTIRMVDTGGWEVRSELDTEILKRVVYDDWHRVERARATFVAEALQLKSSGWVEL